MSSSARRALRILEAVNAAAEPIGVTAVAEAVHTLPGTAFRSLDALERSEFVARHRASTQYELGPAAERLKHTLLAQFPLRTLALPFLRRLSYATRDTVSLTVPMGYHSLRLAVVHGSRLVRSAITTGLHGPMTDDFAGRMILAMMPLDLRPKVTPALSAHLAGIAAAGLSLDRDGTDPHVGVAFPLCHGDTSLGAIAIHGPVHEADSGRAPDELAEWLEIGRELEANVAPLPIAALNPFYHLSPEVIETKLAPSAHAGD